MLIVWECDDDFLYVMFFYILLFTAWMQQSKMISRENHIEEYTFNELLYFGIWCEFFSLRLKDERNVSKAEKERKNTIEIKGEKKRCWLCNQLHFMLFCTQRTSITVTVHSTSFSFIIFMMIWNHSSVFLSFALLRKSKPFFFLSLHFFQRKALELMSVFHDWANASVFFLPFHCLRCST